MLGAVAMHKTLEHWAFRAAVRGNRLSAPEEGGRESIGKLRILRAGGFSSC
jgi:hypothetical protein